MMLEQKNFMSSPEELSGEAQKKENYTSEEQEIVDAVKKEAEGWRSIKDAKEIANSILDKYYKPQALSLIAKAEISIGEIEQAKETLRQAKETASGIDEDEYYKSRALLSIAQAEAEIGEIEQAKETLRQAKETASGISNEYNDDKYDKYQVLLSIAQAEAEIGEIEQAKETLRQAKEIASGIDEDEYNKPRVLLPIAQAEAEIGEIEQAKETASGMDEDEYYKSRALLSIAKAEAEIGEIEQAKETLRQAKETASGIRDEYDKSQALSLIAKAEAEIGEIEQAKETLRQAKEMASGIRNNSRALLPIARAEAEIGEIEQAKETASGIRDEYYKSQALLSIVRAEVEIGEIKQAKEAASGIRNKYYKPQALSLIAKAEAEIGEIEQAKETLRQAKEAASGISNEYFKSRALSLIAQAEAEIGASLINQFQTINKNLTLEQKKEILEKASALDDKSLIRSLGVIISNKERKELSQEFGEKEKDLMQAGYVNTREVPEELEKELAAEYSQRLKEIVKITNEEKQEKYTNRLINEILRDLDNDQSAQAILEVARELPANHKLLPRIMKTLCEIGNVKASDLAVQFMGQEELPDRIVWYIIHKLIEQKYLPDSLGEYLSDKTSQDKRLLKTIRKVISELRLNPDKEVLEYILEREYKDETGQEIQDIEERIKLIKSKKEQFESINDRFELVEKLHQDKDSAILYYILNGGKTRFSLVNSYNSEKFATILKVINEGLGEINDEVLEEWRELLKDNSNYSEEEIKTIEDNLVAGRWIFTGIQTKDKQGRILKKQPQPVQRIRIDVSDSEKLEVIQGKAQDIFGKNQLGTVLKTSFYAQYLKEKGDNELLEKLNSLPGLTGAEELIAEIEDKYPDFLDRVENALNKKWKKLGDKKVLELSLLSVLNEDKNSVDLKKLLNVLEQQRKALKSSLNQKFKALIKNNRDEKEKLIQEKRSILERLEAKDPAKLLGYIVGEIVGKKNLTKTSEKILTEWKSHLQEVFMDYKKIEKSQGKGTKQKSQEITLRYLDKKEDLIACLRFADSAQCCFTSTQYRIEGHDIGNAEWIARIWKDPLSYVYQIEKTEPNAPKREAIGFVFGFFGEKDKKPIVMLNGVYMQNKTNTGAESILNNIENNLSKPMQVSKQIIASRYGGKIKTPKEYENMNGETITRFRALTNRNGSPENKIYDDLGTVVNKEVEVDNAIWGKNL